MVPLLAGATIGAIAALATYTPSEAPLAPGHWGSVEIGATLGGLAGCIIGVLAVRWRKIFRGDEHAPY